MSTTPSSIPWKYITLLIMSLLIIPVIQADSPFLATPTPACPELGVTIEMPSIHFYPGDGYYVKVICCNPGPETYKNIPLFVILDIYGMYFFWPSFSTFDYYIIDYFPPGIVIVDIIIEFQWPYGTGSFGEACWIAAMTDESMTELLGSLDIACWGWSE